MSTNIVSVLMYHRHKLVDLIQNSLLKLISPFVDINIWHFIWRGHVGPELRNNRAHYPLEKTRRP
jgi:hypothetical protein